MINAAAKQTHAQQPAKPVPTTIAKTKAAKTKAAKTKAAKTKAAKVTAAAPQPAARRLVRGHLAAFSVLAGLSVAGQVAVQWTLRAPGADAPTAALAQRQETFSRQIVSSALGVQTAQTPQQRIFWENSLRDTANEWKQSAMTLPRSGQAVTKPLTDAGADQSAMLDTANSLLAALPPDASRDKADIGAYVAPLLSHQVSYNAHMDAVSAVYQSEAAAHAALPKELSAGLCLLTLLTLGALGLRASRPEAAAALVEMEEKKKEQDAALGEADRQIAEMRRTLENLSTIDALTGLQNHRAFQERLDREMGRALRHGQPLSLLLLDVDKFKSYNDSFGHTGGDQALKLIAEILKETARTSDIPARYGGKEFALILTETDMMGAVVLGERLRQAVASADGLQRPLTASIGLATLNGNIFSAPALISQADRALCHAKGDGRNRVSHAHRIPAPLEDEAPVYARAA